MARMIPPSIPRDCPSPGEKEVFARLQTEPGAQDWIVLHSLDIANHVRQVSGEADFVIIVPHVGVLCLEVKACRTLRRQDGLWYYGSDTKGDNRGPFKQASEAMHSLRNRVIAADSSLSGVPFWSAVLFPYVEFSSTSVEWHPWQVLDATKFRNQPMSTLVRSVLQNARSHMASQAGCRWFRESDRVPNVQQSAAIARFLRPCFEYAEKPSDRRRKQRDEILHFTEEQFAALDAMTDNEHVLFTGPAGTGKTVLAVEAARRAANQGQTVLFLCYNRLLAQWISKQPIASNPNITIKTFHQFLGSIAGIALSETQQSDRFWHVDLPEAAVSRLVSESSQEICFDVLIVDEFQDLLLPAYLDVMDLVLKGGLREGRWRMFGDFERQMLYGQDRAVTDNLLKERFGSSPRFALRVNCRNTPRIATLSHLLGKLTPNYTRVLRSDDHIEPAISYYATPSQQRKELVRILELLSKEAYEADEIVVLSPKAGLRSAAGSIKDSPWEKRLSPICDATHGQTPFTTIQSFKGLEALAIVVTDIEHIEGDLFSSLFYVSTTRALERLYILVHETAKSDIVSSLLSNGSQSNGESNA
jgi:hypothetical protein